MCVNRVLVYRLNDNYCGIFVSGSQFGSIVGLNLMRYISICRCPEYEQLLQYYEYSTVKTQSLVKYNFG